LDPANYGDEYGNHQSQELCAAKASAERVSSPEAPMLALLRMVEKDLRNAEEDGCCYFESSRFVRHILNSAQPDQRESAAEEWVRVPVEPSDEMLKAGVRAFQSSYSSDDSLADWREAYKATIAAAPSPAVQPVEQVGERKGDAA
jgi:hypothetical protein